MVDSGALYMILNKGIGDATMITAKEEALIQKKASYFGIKYGVIRDGKRHL